VADGFVNVFGNAWSKVGSANGLEHHVGSGMTHCRGIVLEVEYAGNQNLRYDDLSGPITGRDSNQQPVDLNRRVQTL
jgi:hypothetical protein